MVLRIFCSIFFGFFFTFYCSSCSQSEGRKKVYEYYNDGSVKSTKEKRGESIEGEVVEFYPSGKISSRGEWKQGKTDGIVEHFYENGALKSRGEWKEGKEDGKTEIYFENGVLEFLAEYREGKIIGYSRVFFPNGKMKERKLYGASGDIIHIATYNDGGQLLNRFVIPEIQFSQDTISIGEVVVAKIFFPFKMNGKILVVPGMIESNSDTTFVKEYWQATSSDTITMRRIFYEPGTQNIVFRFEHRDLEASDTLNVDDVLITKKLFVTSSSNNRKS